MMPYRQGALLHAEQRSPNSSGEMTEAINHPIGLPEARATRVPMRGDVNQPELALSGAGDSTNRNSVECIEAIGRPGSKRVLAQGLKDQAFWRSDVIAKLAFARYVEMSYQSLRVRVSECR